MSDSDSGARIHAAGRANAARLMDDYPAMVETHEGVASLLAVAYMQGAMAGASELGSLVRAELDGKL